MPGRASCLLQETWANILFVYQIGCPCQLFSCQNCRKNLNRKFIIETADSRCFDFKETFETNKRNTQTYSSHHPFPVLPNLPCISFHVCLCISSLPSSICHRKRTVFSNYSRRGKYSRRENYSRVIFRGHFWYLKIIFSAFFLNISKIHLILNKNM